MITPLQKSKLKAHGKPTIEFLWDNTGVVIKLPGALVKHTACGGKWDTFIHDRNEASKQFNIQPLTENWGRKGLCHFSALQPWTHYSTPVPQFPHQ